MATLLTNAVGIWKCRVPDDTIPVFPDVADAPPDSRRLIRNRRYCRVLAKQNELPFDEVSLSFAWKALEHDMALVPGGEIRRVCDVIVATQSGFEMVSTPDQVITVESHYVDRDCVTNADFARFVMADGYGNPEYWPEAVLPIVLQFVDSTGQAGPKFWSDGTPPPQKLDHPVVGVCWHEANAYANWAGKRLPLSDEWQRAGTWSKGHCGHGTELRYPWGNGFDPSKANVWASEIGDTVPVTSFSAASTPNGVRQLIGNVWEWVNTLFCPDTDASVSNALNETMAEIRGGAFDTYFQTQASCQFRTGQPLLYRGHNVGFRCCVSNNALVDPSHSITSSVGGQ
ncbi:formylglycine-generating enzyme family protein [Planctomycetes bacterium CA13]|uniref:formylglycine-generating enzyme family protein n=1 Tax=Novipirellula herctigrandis TaxID=2527986 RepID=UPI0011B841D2